MVSGGLPASLLSPPQVENSPAETGSVRIEAAYQAAVSANPSAPLYDILLPQIDTDPVRVVAGSAAQPVCTHLIYTDPTTGGVMGIIEPEDVPPHGLPLLWSYGVHVGAIGGMPTKIIAAACCVVLIGMSITGIVMWLIRKPKHAFGAPRAPAGRPSWSTYGLIVLLALLMPAFAVSVLAIGGIAVIQDRVRRWILYRSV